MWHNGVDNVLQDLCDKVQNLMHLEAQRFNLSLQVTDTGFALFTTKALREGDPICDVSCLWYSTKEKLKHVLSQEGNKAMLDKLLCVEGLYKGNDTARFFGIRVGCAAWARHYLGVRKGGPNAKIVINSHAGFTSNLAQLVVSTRNNLGISQDTEICLNYGPTYDFEVRQKDNEETPCKRFKGALASLFDRSQEADKENKEEPKQQGNPLKRGAEATEAKEGKKNKTLEPEKEDPKKEDPEDSAIIAKDVTGVPGFDLRFQDGQLSLHAKANAAAGNKKVPPGSLLYLIREGKMQKVEALGGVPYLLDPKTVVMIAASERGGPMGLGGKPLPLTAVADQLKIKTIDEFPELVAPGQLPAKMTTTHKYWFVPKDWILF